MAQDKDHLEVATDNHTQQINSNELLTAYQFLAEEFGRVMALAGYSENPQAATKDAMAWIDPAKRPVVE